MKETASRVTIVIPRAGTLIATSSAASRLAGLSERRVAFLDNRKHNAKELLGHMGDHLTKSFGVSATDMFHKKDSSAFPFEDEVYHRVAREFDAAVCAIGD